jgi:hypothetical protein
VFALIATTLWHSDAAEWAPSTASFATDAARRAVRLMSALLRLCCKTPLILELQRIERWFAVVVSAAAGTQYLEAWRLATLYR